MAMDAVMQTGPRNGRAAGFKACDIKGNAVALLVPARKVVRQKARGGARPARSVTRQARRDFLDALTLCGDPAAAAEQFGLSLVRLLRLRAEDAQFAAAWQAAIGLAWELVEHRLLAQLLDPKAAIDSKLALAAIARRDQGMTRGQARTVDSASVARLRAELWSLAGPDAMPGGQDE